MGAGLSGTLSCCHFLCDLAYVESFSEIHAHANSIGNRYANSLRRDPRTSFFALFSDGFLDSLVKSVDSVIRSGAAFLATSKKCALNSSIKEPHAASSGTRFCKDLDRKSVPKVKQKTAKQKFLQGNRL